VIPKAHRDALLRVLVISIQPDQPQRVHDAAVGESFDPPQSAFKMTKHPSNPVKRAAQLAVSAIKPIAVQKVTTLTMTPLPATPKAVKDAYDRAYKEAISGGKSDQMAHAHGARMIRHAGWYKGSRGWRQLTPDLRGKVNVREAIRQPNGRYLVEDVDLFFPNATKGPELPFTVADNREIIENTNRSIAAGGQKPALVEGHTNDEQRMLGIQLDAMGGGINCRESPRGKGWIRCDLVDVPEETVQRLRDLKLPGLSIKIIKDPTGLNPRIGHIALLGGSMQALSHLPGLEVFMAEASNELCFSSDASSFQGVPMFGPKMKDCHAAYASAYAAFEAAEAAHNTGEPGSVEKLRSAGKKLADAFKGLSAECSEGEFGADGGEEPNPPTGGTDGGADMGQSNPLATAPAGPSGEMPQDLSGTSMPGGGSAPAYSTDEILSFASNESNIINRPKDVFLGLSEALRRERSQNQNLTKHVATLTKFTKGMAQNMLRAEFSTEMDKMAREGFVLPGKDILDMNYSSAEQTAEPRSAVMQFVRTLRASCAKKQNPAGQAAIFSASDAPEGATVVDFSSDSQITAAIDSISKYIPVAPRQQHRPSPVSTGPARNPNILV
jgi:hypothetical protein